MQIKQPVRLVALDTEVFDRANFNYGSTAFQQLIELVEEEQIIIYLTKITFQEILSHIDREASKSIAAFKKLHKEFRSEGKILYNSQIFNSLLKIDLDGETFKRELQEQFDTFLKDASLEVISIENVSSEEIFSKYFNVTPPFGEGRKKSEFPDAFSIAALENKSQSEGKKVYVISGDNDWKSACENNSHLIYLDSIDNFLDLLLKEKDAEKVEILYEIFEQYVDDIKSQIEREFIDRQVLLSDDFNADWESEYIDIQVDSVEIADKSIVEIEDLGPDYLLIIFELKIQISFTAHISYNDLEYLVWGEDEKIFALEPTERTIKQIVVMPVEVVLDLYRDASYKLCLNTIDRVSLDPNNTIGTIVIKP